MQPILTQAQQFPDRTAAVQRVICSDVIDEGRPFTDEEHRQLRHVLEQASRITGAVVQPGDTASGGPMFEDGDSSAQEAYRAATGMEPPTSPYPPANIADSTAVPTADIQAQIETGTGAFNPGIPGAGVSGERGPVIPDVDVGGGNFNPEIQIDTSTTSISEPPVTQP